MRTQPKREDPRTGCECYAIEAHTRRVGLATTELTKRLGWSIRRQRATREAAGSHHKALGALNPHLLTSLLGDLWACSSLSQPEADATDHEMARLLELCCFFVQRWEFIPYERANFEQIVDELRTMAQDGYFDPAHVAALSSVPWVNLVQVQQVVSKLPVFPAVAWKAMNLAQNPMATAAQLEAIVESDPVLAGEILKLANTPSHAPALASIRQAVVLLGVQESARILAAAAFRPMFQSPLVSPLWNHSLEVARLSESIARKTGKADPEEAFLVGLMHDVGRLALWRLPPRLASQYAALLAQDCEPMFAETLLCGFDHCVAGREVMAHWGLPDRMVEAVEFHHQPERCHSGLPQVLYLAEYQSGSHEDQPSLARLRLTMQRLEMNGMGCLAN